MFCAECQLSDLCLCIGNRNPVHSYTVLVLVETSLLSTASPDLTMQLRDCMTWEHEGDWKIPSYVPPYWRDIYLLHQPLRQLLNRQVYDYGQLTPLRLIRNWCQVLYSKLKCGVDGLTKFRSVMRSSKYATK